VVGPSESAKLATLTAVDDAVDRAEPTPLLLFDDARVNTAPSGTLNNVKNE